jgi:hypothetical protein
VEVFCLAERPERLGRIIEHKATEKALAESEGEGKGPAFHVIIPVQSYREKIFHEKTNHLNC